jgi:undecaprenyl-diphosphatase
MIDYDESWFLTLNQFFATPVFTWFFKHITLLGNGWVQIFLVTPALFFLSRDKFRDHVVAIMLTALTSGLLISVIKVAVDRPRPPETFAERIEPIHAPGRVPGSRSFPSGHTQTAFATAGYLSLLYPAMAPLFLAVAMLVGVSRIALGVHFPLDVLTGAIIGFSFAVMGFRLNRARLRRRAGGESAQIH